MERLGSIPIFVNKIQQANEIWISTITAAAVMLTVNISTTWRATQKQSITRLTTLEDVRGACERGMWEGHVV